MNLTLWRAAACGSNDALDLISQLQRKTNKAAATRARALADRFESENDAWPKKARAELANVADFRLVHDALADAKKRIQSGKPTTSTLEFSASTRFLRECWEYLTNDPNHHERMHLVTGPITTCGVRVLSQIEKLTLEQQSTTYVRVNPAASHKRILRLTGEEGHEILAAFHCHPMTGPKGTAPSGTDIDYQERQAKIGCDAIGGIFTRDGFVRFFSTSNDIRVDIYGSGWELISSGKREFVFKLPIGVGDV